MADEHVAKRKLSDDEKYILIDFFEKNKPLGHRDHSLEIMKKKTLRMKNWLNFLTKNIQLTFLR